MDNPKFIGKLGLTLQDAAALQVASQLWGNSGMVAELMKLGEPYFKVVGGDVTEKRREWCFVLDKAKKQVNKLTLPFESRAKVDMMMMILGEKILLYLITLVSRKKFFNFKYAAHKLFWTTVGAIDEPKIFSYWKDKDPKFPGFEPNDSVSQLIMFAQGCMYADLDFVKDNLEEIGKLIKKHIGKLISDFNAMSLGVNSAMTIILLYIKAYGVNYDFLNLYSTLRSKDYKAGTDKMFVYCVAEGWKGAAEYFYKKLKNNDKLTKILNQAASECLVNALEVGSSHQRDKHPELLLYVFGKMSQVDRNDFVRKNIVSIFSLFLKTWPYQQLCEKILDEFWNTVKVPMKIALLKKTVDMFKILPGGETNTYNGIYLPILKNVMSKTPGHLKLDLFRNPSHFFELFFKRNFSTIKFIVNDPDLVAHKSDLIDISPFWYEYLIAGGRSENIRKYISELKLSEAEELRLLKFIFTGDGRLLENLFLAGFIDSADDVLKWRCMITNETVSEGKRQVKIYVNTKNFVSAYVSKGQYDLIEKYLQWQSEGDEKIIEELKSEYFTADFICQGFWTVWIRNAYDEAEKECEEFINFFFKNDDEIRKFNVEVLKGERFLHIPFNHNIGYIPTISEKIIPNLDKVLKFFLITPEQISEFKKGIRDNIRYWLDTHKAKFLIVNSLVNWVCETKEQKKTLVQNYLKTPEGILFCMEIFKSYLNCKTYEYWQSTIEIFVNEWVKPYGNVEEIKSKIKKLDKRSGYTEREILKVTRSFDKLGL